MNYSDNDSDNDYYLEEYTIKKGAITIHSKTYSPRKEVSESDE